MDDWWGDVSPPCGILIWRVLDFEFSSSILLTNKNQLCFGPAQTVSQPSSLIATEAACEQTSPIAGSPDVSRAQLMLVSGEKNSCAASTQSFFFQRNCGILHFG